MKETECKNGGGTKGKGSGDKWSGTGGSGGPWPHKSTTMKEWADGWWHK